MALLCGRQQDRVIPKHQQEIFTNGKRPTGTPFRACAPAAAKP
jgi:hypothetical protein